MTAATRDPEDDELDAVRWNDRALFGTFRGLPWWAAVLSTFVLAVIGTYVDVTSAGKTVGWVFAILFFLGAVGAVVFVERRSMFGPVVQPPLVLAIVVPLVVIVTSGIPDGGLASIGLGLGKPLIDGFPAMAITTLCTVAVGIFRVTTQKDPNRLTREEIREAKRKDAEDRPKRREPAEPRDDRPRRKPAPASDEPRPKRPRPAGEDRPQGDRPRRPPGGDHPAKRKPRPRDED